MDDRFPLPFYYRIANQILFQAKVYRDEGNLAQLYQTLHRYSRLVSDTIPQHRSYSTYSSKDKQHHNKILQKVVKEIERVRPVLGMKDQAVTCHNVGKVSYSRKEPIRSCRHEDSDMRRNVQLAPDVRVDKKCHSYSRSSFPLTLTALRDNSTKVQVVQHHFPPVLSCVEKLPLVGHVSHINSPELTDEHFGSLYEGSSTSKAIQDVHISARLMEEFMELASDNTKKSVETCGILGANLKNRTFYVTTLIIPKQESTAHSCQALNEEEIHAIQDGQSLFPVGWIHTHPSQTCFLSSIDLHTQYSYQVMLPEAIAIVMAPTDSKRNHGIFRLTDPGGMTILKQCRESGGFHLHPETCCDGSPIYENCSHVYMNSNMRLEIIDLRSDRSS